MSRAPSRLVAAGALALALGVQCSGAASVVAGTRHVARGYVFRAERARDASLPAGGALRTFSAADGAPVHALELPGPPGARVVVHFHNNSDAMTAALPTARALSARGLGVLLVEYRGYGISRDDGAPAESGLYLDAAAALDWLRARGDGPDRIVLWGTSLGTGVAAEMAQRGRCAALVLVAPFTSIPDLVRDRAPLLPAGWLLPDHFDTLAKASAIHVPTLVVHGDADEVVPFSMGQQVAKAIAGARLLRVEGGHHGDLFARDGAEIVDEIARYAGGERLGESW